MIEYLLENSIADWHKVSLDSITRSLSNPEKKKAFNLYLQTQPEGKEKHRIKEMMIE